MKKSIKWLICLVTALAVSAAIGALAACGGGEKDPPAEHTTHVDADSDGKCDECGEDMPVTAPEYKTPAKNEDYWLNVSDNKGDIMKENVSEKEISYQFSTIYEHVSNTQPTRTYYLLINLYGDGYLRAYQYYPEGTLFEYGGYWRNDGTYLTARALEYGLAYNGTSNVYTYGQNIELSMSNGTFTFAFSISLGNADGGLYLRQASFTNQSGAITYATTQAWLDYVGEETGDTVTQPDFSDWAPETESALAEVTLYYGGNTESSVTQPLKFESDGTYTIADGAIEGTLEVNDGVFTATGALTYDAATKTITYTVSQTQSFSAVLTAEQLEVLGLA